MDSGHLHGRWRVAGAVLSLVMVFGGIGVSWWLIGDLTEGGVRDPSYMVPAPEWADHHPRLIGLVGCLLAVVGVVISRLLVARCIDPSAQIRMMVVQFFCVVDGLFIGLILRLLTIGTDGASFIGLTIFFGVPSALVLTVALLVVGDRLIGSGKLP